MSTDIEIPDSKIPYTEQQRRDHEIYDANIRGLTATEELIHLTAPEVRRLLCRLLWQRPPE